jgi:hypothetical protein
MKKLLAIVAVLALSGFAFAQSTTTDTRSTTTDTSTGYAPPSGPSSDTSNSDATLGTDADESNIDSARTSDQNSDLTKGRVSRRYKTKRTHRTETRTETNNSESTTSPSNPTSSGTVNP